MKDAAKCRTSGQSEYLSSALTFFRSTVTPEIYERGEMKTVEGHHVKERGQKRKECNEKDRVWICEKI